MTILHTQVEGHGWRELVPATDAEADAVAHTVCREAVQQDREAVVLVEREGAVREVYVTFANDADAEPWWSHRTVEPTSAEVARRDPHALNMKEVVGNYEA